MMKIPADFPRDPSPASLAGMQPKFAARLIDSKLVVGLTHEELFRRYDTCEDLARQLVAYYARSASEHPDWSKELILERIRDALRDKVAIGVWDLSASEQEWVMGRLEKLLNRHPEGASENTHGKTT